MARIPTSVISRLRRMRRVGFRPNRKIGPIPWRNQSDPLPPFRRADEAGMVRLRQSSGLENGRVGAHIRNMKRERYEARALGWYVVRIDPNGTESTVEVWPERKSKHRAAVLDRSEEHTSELQSL